METKTNREEDNSPAQDSEDQQMSPEVSALSRTPTPASVCPVPSPIQRPIRIHQQRSHRKFLLAIPAITVLAVAAVVLFYAITWNDSPPPNRSDDVEARKGEVSKGASGRMSDFGDDEVQQGPSQRGSKNDNDRKTKKSDFSSSNDISIGDSKDKSRGDSSEGLSPKNLPPAGMARELNWMKVKATTEKELGDMDSFDSVPWPTYSDTNFTDEDVYSEEMLFKVDKLLSRTTKHPFFIDLVESKRNFSEANRYCKHRNGYLMQLFNIQEELYFSRVLAHSDLFNSKCNNGFLGFRKILEEDIKVKGFKVATFADPLSAMSEVWVTDGQNEAKGSCVVLYHNQSTHTFGLTKKPCKHKLSCYLCETARGCPAPSCYFWHYKMNTTVTYNEAKELCLSEKGGTLARIRNKVTLNLLKEALNVSTANSIFNLYSENACSQGYFVEKEQLGLSQFGFENEDEQQITYKSPAILQVKQEMVEGHYCLAVSKEHGLRWMPVPCTDLRCFFCRYDRA